MKEILIIRSKKGNEYAETLAKKINDLGAECCGTVCWTDLDEFLVQNKCSPEKTLLHYRTAGPNVNPKAYELEKQGYRLINPARVLERTSDKFKSYEWGYDHKLKLPLTKKVTKGNIKQVIDEFSFQKFVLKPINSQGQGAFCFSSSFDDPEIENKLSQIPAQEIIIQDLIKYIKIYRVIVIGNKILDQAVFYDKPSSSQWKVSVCLNPNMKLDKNPDQKLLSYAKDLAAIFETEISFIDIYETKDGYILSEINTACNLTLHEQKSGYTISEDIAKYLISELNRKI